MADPLPARCRNCAAPLHDRYCGRCGQGHHYDRLRLGALLEDSVEGTAQVDSTVLRTICDLTFRPAEMITAYLRGRRIPYMHPLKYALVMCSIWLVVSGLQAPLRLPNLDESSTWKQMHTLQRDFGQVLRLASAPLLAWALTGRFRSTGLSFLEHLVAVLYCYGHMFLLGAMASIVLWTVRAPELLGGQLAMLLGLHMSVVLASLYGGRRLLNVVQIFIAWFGVGLLTFGATLLVARALV